MDALTKHFYIDFHHRQILKHFLCLLVVFCKVHGQLRHSNCHCHHLFVGLSRHQENLCRMQNVVNPNRHEVSELQSNQIEELGCCWQSLTLLILLKDCI